jgi:hypothetical protein
MGADPGESRELGVWNKEIGWLQLHVREYSHSLLQFSVALLVVGALELGTKTNNQRRMSWEGD